MSDALTILNEYAGDVVTGLQNIPEPIKRNFVKAVASLVTGLADVPASYLEMKAAEFKVKTRGHELLMNAAAKNAAQLAKKSPEIANRALAYFAADLVCEQSNREAIVKQALNAAENLESPKSEIQISEIDDDWLHQFRKIAAIKSNAEIQKIWGSILAGEIYKPGSFAPMTLEVMARLDRATAKAFEQLVNVTVITEGHWDTVVTSVLDENSIKHVEILHRSTLMQLESVGLITTLGVQTLNPMGFTKLRPSTLGGQKVTFSEYHFKPTPRFSTHGSIVYLTQAGGELQSIIPKTFNAVHAKLLRDGLRRSGVEMSFIEIDLDMVQPKENA